VLSLDLFNVYVNDLPERLIATCNRFDRCPRFGGVRMPMVMYADDQTLMHWNPECLQAMLPECEAYANDHQYMYNINKCEITHP
jgi:hypothetical protein